MTEPSRSAASKRRSSLPSPRKCCWPTNSSSVVGRMRPPAAGPHGNARLRIGRTDWTCRGVGNGSKGHRKSIQQCSSRRCRGGYWLPKLLGMPPTKSAWGVWAAARMSCAHGRRVFSGGCQRRNILEFSSCAVFRGYALMRAMRAAHLWSQFSLTVVASPAVVELRSTTGTLKSTSDL